MAVAVSISATDILSVLRMFLLSVLPTGTEVVRGQVNRVAQPKAPDFVVMSPPSLSERLATDVRTFTDNYPAAGVRADLKPSKVTVQLDVYGPNSMANSEAIITVFRSEVAADSFAASGFDIVPLYTSDPRQLAFIDSEQQFEDRYSVDVVMQVNQVITSPQEFAASLTIGIIDVDATYPA